MPLEIRQLLVMVAALLVAFVASLALILSHPGDPLMDSSSLLLTLALFLPAELEED